jgi:hypothetical protein
MLFYGMNMENFQKKLNFVKQSLPNVFKKLKKYKMGLTIHYSARIKSRNLIPQLTDEIADICQSMGWEFDTVDKIVEMKDDVTFTPPLDDHKNIRLQGIMFHPPKCESVIFTFLPSGWTSSYLHLMVAKDYQRIESVPIFKDFPKLVYMMHTKTQRGGPDTHIAIIKLFRYLEKKYFAEFRVSDEGNYWETEDKTVLQERFDEYTGLINSFKGALENDGWAVTHEPFLLTNKMKDLLDRKDEKEE